MRAVRPLVAALVLLLVPACAIKKPPAGPQSAKFVPGDGIFLLVNSSREGITVSGVSPVRNPKISGKLTLPSPGWEQHPIGTEELIVGAHDKYGMILGAYGFPVRRIAFHDTIREKGHALEGGMRGLSSVAIPVTVPYAPGTAFLSFWRVIIRARDAHPTFTAPERKWEIEGKGPYGPVVLAVDPLGAAPLSKRMRDIGSMEFPHSLLMVERLPPRALNPAILDWFITTGRINLAWACPSGAYTSANLGTGTDPATSFNVVILGDGYTDLQMPDFRTKAQDVTTALLANAPFSKFASRTNVYTVETPSTQSGVDQCPNHCTACPCGPLAPDPVTTALEVHGDASGTGTCTEFEADPIAVLAAGCSVLRPSDVDLYIVLVDCDVYGGMTYPSTRTIFVASGFAASLIEHEAGHALAMIGEEYLGGAMPCLDASCTTGCAFPVPFLNVALPADVASGKISWLPLAEPNELNSGTLKTVETKSGGGRCYGYGGLANATSQTLGLYWGAQYLADEPDVSRVCPSCHTCRVTVGGMCGTMCLDTECDDRGADFYRPMPYCKMRNLDDGYCRVCYCALDDVLVGATGLPSSSTLCLDMTPPGTITDLHRTDDR